MKLKFRCAIWKCSVPTQVVIWHEGR
ncbi:unnamed protein product [Spirodela intermedia]|uniref:Uncharacterized protein n=1 Tax=Spirodela intermedia TaxID=51605 RepID=A0A7I8LGQ4_SPIIN|nr:unnamed protein product [Spirodela intermedia]